MKSVFRYNITLKCETTGKNTRDYAQMHATTWIGSARALAEDLDFALDWEKPAFSIQPKYACSECGTSEGLTVLKWVDANSGEVAAIDVEEVTLTKRFYCESCEYVPGFVEIE